MATLSLPSSYLLFVSTAARISLSEVHLSWTILPSSKTSLGSAFFFSFLFFCFALCGVEGNRSAATGGWNYTRSSLIVSWTRSAKTREGGCCSDSIQCSNMWLQELFPLSSPPSSPRGCWSLREEEEAKPNTPFPILIQKHHHLHPLTPALADNKTIQVSFVTAGDQWACYIL